MLIKAIFALMIAHAVVVGIESVTDLDIQGKKAEPEVRITSIIG
jgi:hypothetical protein